MYHEDIPAFLTECMKTPILKRLKLIGMNCGCEYTSFPQFAGLDSYSRYDHSIGVALIIWHFTGNRAQTIAGLLHDVASPVFSHAVDFMHGDYLKQESTEDGTERLIAGSVELQAILRKYELTTADVCDYHHLGHILQISDASLVAGILAPAFPACFTHGLVAEDHINQGVLLRILKNFLMVNRFHQLRDLLT